jgi:Serine dehydrogenase proteinase
MGRPERRALIERIEQQRASRVVTYVTSDRPPAPAQIGDDALRPLYDHLRELGHVERLDLFIYSRGGAIDVPWRMVTALRQASDEWNILVPFRANSAATLIALGADNIVLGHQGELGPIDPIMSLQRVVTQPGGAQTILQEQVSVEDVMAYTRFIRDRANLSDQSALADALGKLAERMDAVALGNVYRTHLHIRDVARRTLLSRKSPPSEQALSVIVETLAERVYAHGHAIGFKEADALGLPVVAADDQLDTAMWELLNDYETEMRLLQPLDPVSAIGQTDRYQEDAMIAVVESVWALHGFVGRVEVQGRRQMPPNLSVTLNMNLQLPQNMNPAQAPQALQTMLQQAQQSMLQQAQQAVQQALRDQAPLAGVEASFRGGSWQKLD